MPFAAGTQLSRYIIQSLLGTGAMGEVYLARDLKLQRLVALKVLLPEKANDPKSLRRFLLEARTASALNHPNVAHIYEIEDAQGVNFIALEYVNGETLRTHLRRARMTPSKAVEVALQVGSAIAAAHAMRIIHRDIKPENIILTSDGHVKVLDFGLAKLATGPDAEGLLTSATISQGQSEPGLMIGTISYMSPEQTRGQVLDIRTDIWSLGVVFYEMITGHLPFEGETSTDVIAAILKQAPAPLDQLPPEICDDLELVFTKALSKELDKRYRSVREMQNDLRSLSQTAAFQSAGEKIRPLASADNSEKRRTSGASDRSPDGRKTKSMSSAEYVVSTIQKHKFVSVTAGLLLTVMIAVVSYSVISSRHSSRVDRPPLPLRRITFHPGLQMGPTWSPDGNFLAFSSDRSGNFDIWVQSVNGGEAIRITSFDEHEWQPDWSPDGNWIVFRSERDGGGLYRVPAPFGGQVQQIAPFGYGPRWSPDGSRILFLRQGMRLYERPRAYVTSGDGSSPPREVLTRPSGDEGGIRRGALAWHPDGQRVSYWGEDKVFWTVPIEGGSAIKSEVSDDVAQRLKQAGVDLGVFRWAPRGDYLYFEGRSQGLMNIWRIGVDVKTLSWTSGPERLTASEGQDTEVALSRNGSKLAFTKKNQATTIWLFPFDARRGQIKGEGQAITGRDVEAWFPDLSPDGKKLVYSVYRQGMTKRELWERSLQTSDERKIKEVENRYPFYPRWSPDSTHIAYSPIEALARGKSSGSIVLLDTETGNEQPLASLASNQEEPWRDYTSDWSRDGRWVIASSDRGSPERWYIAMFPVANAPHAELNMRTVLSDPESNLWSPRVSPDGNWICFLKQNPTETASSVLYVVSVTGGAPIRVTEEGLWADKPRWSPDGSSIYFIYNRDSYFLNIWSIRFDPFQGKPRGEPLRVTKLSSPGKMVATVLSALDISLNENRLALPITEASGNIWMIENLEP